MEAALQEGSCEAAFIPEALVQIWAHLRAESVRPFII